MATCYRGRGYACTPPTPALMADDPTSGTAADLARHARGAHDPITAAKASVWAGEQAAARWPRLTRRSASTKPRSASWPKSARLPQRLRASTRSTSTVRASNAAMVAGQPIRALGLLQDQLSALEGVSPPVARARLLRALAGAALVVDSGLDVRALASEALSLVPTDPPSPLRAELLGVLAQAQLDFDRRDVIPLASRGARPGPPSRPARGRRRSSHHPGSGATGRRGSRGVGHALGRGGRRGPYGGRTRRRTSGHVRCGLGSISRPAV